MERHAPTGSPIFAGHTGEVYRVAFSADNRTVLTASDDDRTVRLWDVASGRQVPPQIAGPQGASVRSAVFSPDGKYVLTADGRPDDQAHIWDIRTGAEVRAFPVNSIVDDAVYSPDGKTVLTGSSDKNARLWDAASGALLHVLMGHTGGVYGVAFAPDGKTVLTSGADGTPRLWDVRSGTTIRSFNGHTDDTEGLAYSPDGTRVLTGSQDKTARLWDLQTGALLGTFSHAAGVNAVAFSPDGNRILTASGDGVAHLWDIAGAPTTPNWGRELRRFTGHGDAVLAVAFSHDGKYVLTGSADHTARIWFTDDHDTIRTVCGLLTRDLTRGERTQYDIRGTDPTCPPGSGTAR